MEINTETHCKICGCIWEDHDFGVPAPYCPGPIINKEAAKDQEKELKRYFERKRENYDNFKN